MVQRKVEQDKLGIQANLLIHDQYHNHNHSQKSLTKPLSSHHHNQDRKSIRGPEVKKKMMKKSRSFKLSEIGQKGLKPQPSQHVPKSLEASPNYMRSTTCSDAKKELRSKASSSKLVRNLTETLRLEQSVGSAKKCSKVGLFASPGRVDVQRPTCSSTLKDSKFPSYLMLSHGGTESEGNSVVKVCPYTYCSLNGHLHKCTSLPPLKRFLSDKRRALKTQKSSELDEDRVGIELFVQDCAEKEAQEVESLSEEVLEEIGVVEASDMEVEEDEVDSCSEMDEACQSVSGTSSEIEDGTADSLGMNQELCCKDDEFEDLSSEETETNEIGGVFEAEEVETSRNDLNDHVCIASPDTNEDEQMKEEQAMSEETETNEIGGVFEAEEVETSQNDLNDNVCIASPDANEDEQVKEEHAVSEETEKIPEESSDSASRNQAIDTNISICEEEEEQENSRKRDRYKREAKKSLGGDDQERDFNPREPNYLPLVADPEGEKVDLKHQDMDERKNSEEWMIDRALQQTVTKLGSARKRRVALLVEAFETVTPVSKQEALHRRHQHHHHPTSPVFQNPIWPIQACN